MYILLMKRAVVIFTALLSLLSSFGYSGAADSCSGYDFPSISATFQKPGTLRVMSFNIRNADVNGVPVSDRIDVVERQILEIMPDSFGVQEATAEWMAALDADLEMYDWVGADMDSGGNPLDGGVASPVFYLRDRFGLVDSGNFWLSDTPDVPSKYPGASRKRICTWALLKDKSTGETFVHINSHFDHVSEEARLQGGIIVNRFIEERFADTPVVFTVDLNTTEKEEAYAAASRNLTDTRNAAADSVFYGTYHAGENPAKRKDRIIDFIFCSERFSVSVYRTVTKGVGGRFSSDHFPVYADLKFI